MADPSTSPSLSRAGVQAARERIRPYVHHTPTLTNATLTALASSPTPPASSDAQSKTAETVSSAETEARAEVGRTNGGAANAPKAPVMRLYFKCENMQRIGAFKARGAFHALGRLMDQPGWLEGGGREKGVVTHSSGNHAQALSLAARQHGIPAHIVMPTISPPPKIAATKGYGANVVFSGSTSTEREAETARVMKETGATLIPPYDHPDIILGQGTLGLELQEDAAALIAAEEEATAGEAPAFFDYRAPAKGLDVILAPCGGGGMLSGVALSCEGTGIKVFGCEPSHQGADDAKRGYESGTRVEAVKSLTIADGLRTPLGNYPWQVIYERRLVSGFFSVDERQIRDAMRLVYERMKMVIEPSGAVPLAVALYNDEFRNLVAAEAGEEGWDVGIVFSGGNVELEALGKLFAPE
ncbi:pyridoxal-phosphate dependent enzyme-domain-containing protein [Microdochium trichocladiopsis]|uniref:Pyridoxal-phosphate dependent enzyme-domain-containing protein n=1 Tax=Microdochium trichocladiopsis TaxID=1682393 RepID=A0A9P8XY88_9PEZI|nr:pyridoxal-phosphate dependent enzyme-domain-containing protein [Microdochium trichocladiopsis]KAH7025860.1 pyridoxal-phosphate dependent enzyme-domain-containing protein [Microdochium trichocladiopsis]